MSLLSSPGKFQITVPKQAHEYLIYLATIGKGGSSVPDVAAFLLVETINERMASGWHDPKVPAVIAPQPAE